MRVVFHAHRYDVANSHFSQFCETGKNSTAHTTILPPVATAEGKCDLDKFLIPKFHSAKI